MIDKKNNIPYYIQIKEDLLNNICTGLYKEKIPTEFELSNLYGVSRATVREAIKELVRNNVLDVIKGKGMFIKPVTLTPLPGVDKVASFSDILTNKGLKTISNVLKLEISPADNRISKILSISKGSPIIQFKRARLIGKNIAILTDAYLKYELCLNLLNVDLNVNELFVSIEKKLGIKIKHIKRIIEPALPNTEQSTILKINENSPIIYMQSFIHTESDLLFGYIEDFFKHEYA
ncbi:MAG: GntR family transcriptional regulator, partial [Candidatus Humimicrobiaceae bacterium]